jgi:NADH-quinone oxidoreductase subunit J
VDIPARLPDGSFEELSVSTILRHRRTQALTDAAVLSVGSAPAPGSDDARTARPADEEGIR